jgi:hypothetical protein
MMLPGDGHRLRFYQKCKIGKFEKIKKRIFRFSSRPNRQKDIAEETAQKFAEDGRLKAYGSGGRKPPTISAKAPVYSFPSLIAQD